jgi:exopolyphosphatase/guanosine-5'-triphosphate,3'-diphosphate pyrophosphatase
LQERLNIKGIPANRVDLIVVAFILVNFVIQNGDVEEIIVCDYAMKEGVLIEMMNNAKSDF